MHHIGHNIHMDALKEILNHTVYKTVSGSRSYGINTPTSDEDALGVFIPRPENILGVTDSVGKHYRRTEPDENYKTLPDFIACARDGSSFWVEPLFVRREDVLVIKPCFEPFLENKKLFLTQALISKSLGFMKGMVNSSISQKSIPETKNLSEEEQLNALMKSKQKNMCHAVRVGNMIVEMLDEYDLRVYRPEEREHLLNIKSGVISLEDARNETAELVAKIGEKRVTSNLPDIADENILNSLLVSSIQKYWSAENWI